MRKINRDLSFLISLDKLQNSLVKKCMGLGQWCHSTPLMNAVGIMPVSVSRDISSLELLKACVLSNSITYGFYCAVLNGTIPLCSKTLAGRSKKFCDEEGVNVLKYIFNDRYASFVKRTVCDSHIIRPGVNGLVDTLRSLIYTDYNSSTCAIVNNMLKAF